MAIKQLSENGPCLRIIRPVSAEASTWLVATRPQRYERVTIADVAREAGVNKGTVSRALRGMGGVGPTTRERILAAADRLDFTASHLATALATGQSQIIGIVVPSLRSWYFSEVASGASEILSDAGFRVELISLDADSDHLAVDSAQFRRLFRELGAGRGRDALLFASNISVDQGPAAPGSGHLPAAAVGLPLTSVPGHLRRPPGRWTSGRRAPGRARTPRYRRAGRPDGRQAD